MAELVDALDSKSSSFESVGSIPTQGTKRELLVFSSLFPVLFFSVSYTLIRNNKLIFGIRPISSVSGEEKAVATQCIIPTLIFYTFMFSILLYYEKTTLHTTICFFCFVWANC